jgi:hypothetical protein
VPAPRSLAGTALRRLHRHTSGASRCGKHRRLRELAARAPRLAACLQCLRELQRSSYASRLCVRSCASSHRSASRILEPLHRRRRSMVAEGPSADFLSRRHANMRACCALFGWTCLSTYRLQAAAHRRPGACGSARSARSASRPPQEGRSAARPHGALRQPGTQVQHDGCSSRRRRRRSGMRLRAGLITLRRGVRRDGMGGRREAGDGAPVRRSRAAPPSTTAAARQGSRTRVVRSPPAAALQLSVPRGAAAAACAGRPRARDTRLCSHACHIGWQTSIMHLAARVTGGGMCARGAAVQCMGEEGRGCAIVAQPTRRSAASAPCSTASSAGSRTRSRPPACQVRRRARARAQCRPGARASTHCARASAASLP